MYLYGASFLLLVLLSEDFRLFAHKIFLTSAYGFLFALPMVLGTVLSISSPFLKRKTGRTEKGYLLLFVIFSNWLIGYYVLVITANPETHLINLYQFPTILNIAYTFVLVNRWDKGTIDESIVSDQKPRFSSTLAVTITLGAVYALFYYVLKTSWAITYTWCVTAALVVKDLVDYLAPEVSPSLKPDPNTQP